MPSIIKILSLTSRIRNGRHAINYKILSMCVCLSLAKGLEGQTRTSDTHATFILYYKPFEHEKAGQGLEPSRMTRGAAAKADATQYRDSPHETTIS